MNHIKLCPQTTTVSGAFMAMALQGGDFDKLMHTWDQGCYGLVDELVGYAPYLTALVQAVLDAAPNLDYPGVFDYEVSESFGAWFKTEVMKDGSAPIKADAYEWMKCEVLKFFNRSPNTPEQHVAVSDAIEFFAYKAPEV